MFKSVITTATQLLKWSINTSSSSVRFSSSYKSSVSLSSIYPNSNLDITKKHEFPVTEGSNFSGYIPIEKLTIAYCRSGGPGGQNINKSNTKVDVRFDIESAEWLTTEIKSAVTEKNQSIINKDGCLVIKSEKTRSQALNLADAMDKLRHIIHTSIHIPQPLSQENIERHRRKHEAASRERVRQKRAKSILKRNRRGMDADY